MASKRKADDTICGYLLSVSDIKAGAKSNRKYFDGTIQVAEDEVRRLVVFTPEKHEKYLSALTQKAAVSLKNAELSPNKSSVDVLCGRNAEINITEGLPYRRKLFPSTSGTDKGAEFTTISSFKSPFEKVYKYFGIGSIRPGQTFALLQFF